jgi:sulfatase maturation enzyme AslB (radical SAM superfamily)
VCACESVSSDVCQFGKTVAGGDIMAGGCAGESCCKITCFQVDREGNIYECEGH